MPAYQCASPMGMLTETMKSQVATAITDAHVAATGGPREFVHVFFTELPQGAAYSAGRPDTSVSMITGTIRTGRTLEVKQQLIKTIAEAWSQITGQPLAHLVAAIAEIPPEVVMEYGLFLPAPGDEAEWFSANSDVLQGIND
jgi:phenylpyruvate tautomerase PptA (4-oxalocrotonate tautomerase family)